MVSKLRTLAPLFQTPGLKISNCKAFSPSFLTFVSQPGRAVKEQPSYTAYWTRGMTSIHPEENRFLSPRECARIQSFPDRFIFHGTTIENYTQICNAVPPLVARAFGRYLVKVLLGKEISTIPWNGSEKTQNKLIGSFKQDNEPTQLRLPI